MRRHSSISIAIKKGKRSLPFQLPIGSRPIADGPHPGTAQHHNCILRSQTRNLSQNAMPNLIQDSGRSPPVFGKISQMCIK